MTSFIDELPAWPEEDFAQFGDIEIRPRNRIQQLVGRFLGRNWVQISHVTHHDDVDVTDVERRRHQWNKERPDAKVTPAIPVLKAVALALGKHPQFATSLDKTGKNLVQKHYAHVGIAVEVPSGLLVPVLRDCDTKPVSVLAAELAAIAEKARKQGLSMDEMSGGCISVSSLGHIGGTAFTPIVNAPEVAIIGLTKLQDRPFPGGEGQGIVWRRMLPVSLSYDHRVINGADAARFVRTLGDVLADLPIG